MLCVPDVVPAGTFWELENLLFEFVESCTPDVVPAGAFGELEM